MDTHTDMARLAGEPGRPHPESGPPWLVRRCVPVPFRTHGPLRNAYLIAVLTTLLAASMLVENLFFPFPGEAYAAFNTFSRWATASLLVVSLGSFLALLAGWHLTGRLGLVLYGCCLVGTMHVTMGPGSGVDILGTICLIFAPALIFGRTEKVAMALALGASLGTAVGLQIWNQVGGGPLIFVSSDLLPAVRLSVVLVAALVGAFVIYLYWSTEAARRVIQREKTRSEDLLRNILPAEVAERLKRNPGQIADRIDAVTVLFADIAGFTRFAAAHPPTEVVGVLDRLFSAFDDLCERFHVEKIKTIGDGYVAVAGLPQPRPDHAEAAADLALHMQEAMTAILADYPELGLRIGMNSGPVVAGVIGKRKFAYDMWGDTVNIASRMESSGVPGRIAVSAATLEALGPGWRFESRGELELKGKGAVPAWFLLGRDAALADGKAAAE